MIDFNELGKALESSLKAFVEDDVKDYANQALADGSAFLKAVKDDLERWTTELAEGKIMQDEFKSLIIGQENLAKMEALKQAGLAQVRLDEIRNGILNIVVDTALKFLP
jgi:hypothetical protein